MMSKLARDAGNHFELWCAGGPRMAFHGGADQSGLTWNADGMRTLFGVLAMRLQMRRREIEPSSNMSSTYKVCMQYRRVWFPLRILRLRENG